MKPLMKPLVKYVSLGAAMVLCVPAVAYEQGTKILRVGSATVSPDVSSSALGIAGTELPGTSVDVDSGSALGITGVYMFRDHWGIEVVAATPFSHDIKVEGLGETLSLGETKHLPPTVLLQWFPMDSSSAIQPYVGLGVNYTVFFDEEISGAAKDFFGTDDIEMTLDSSIGLAAEAGIDFTFGARGQWMFNLAVWWMDIDTEAEVDIQGVKVTADVELDPLAYMAGFGYRF